MVSSNKGILQSHAPLVNFFQRLADCILLPLSLLIIVLLSGVRWLDFYAISIVLFVVIYLVVARYNGLYSSHRGERFRQEVRLVLQAYLAPFVLIILLAKNTLINVDMPWLMELGWPVLSLASLIGYRYAIRVGLQKLRAQGYNTRSAAVLGSGSNIDKLIQSITKSDTGFKLDNHYSMEQVDDLLCRAAAGEIDYVFVAPSHEEVSQVQSTILSLADTTCEVRYVPDLFIANLLHSRAMDLDGLPIISIYESPLHELNDLVKRTFDLIVGGTILLLISPVLLILSLMIKLTSRGPVIFKQARYGIDGKPIKVWKFRSMKVMEDDENVVQATRNDSRITWLGGFMRRTSLDELPQFINVMRGDMSIVGPRPHAVSHNEEYRKLVHGYMLRHKVKPGITGLAQIKGWRGETDTLEKMEKRIEFDLEYICNWSLWLDIKIVFLTVFRGFKSDNAY